MARRRYISTDISIDSKINSLSDQSALLYTWALPHFADDCRLTPRNAAEVKMAIVPGRDWTLADIQKLIEEIISTGLWYTGDDGRFYVPSDSFYKYQTYINAANRRKTPQIAEESRKTAENAASPSLTLSLSPSPKRIRLRSPQDAADKPNGKSSVGKKSRMPPDFCVTDHHREWASDKGFRSPDLLFEAFRDHHTKLGSVFADWDAALRTWVRNDTEKFGNNKQTAQGMPKFVR